MGDIAHGLGTTHPAAVRLVDRLEKKELVQKAESKADRRISLVELTDLGREALDKIVAKRTDVLAQALWKVNKVNWKA